MNKLISYLAKPKTLLAIVSVETILLIVIGGVILKNSAFYRSQSMVLAESANEETLTLQDDIQSCFQLPKEQRSTCATIIGTKLTNSTLPMQEKIRICMELRPSYNRFCLEALQSGQ